MREYLPYSKPPKGRLRDVLWMSPESLCHAVRVRQSSCIENSLRV